MEKYKEDTEWHGNWLSWDVQKTKQLDSNGGQATEPRDRATETCFPLGPGPDLSCEQAVTDQFLSFWLFVFYMCQSENKWHYQKTNKQKNSERDGDYGSSSQGQKSPC